MEVIKKCYSYNTINGYRRMNSFNKCHALEKDTLYQDKFISRLFNNYSLENSL